MRAVARVSQALRRPMRVAPLSARSMASEATFDLNSEFLTHKCDGPSVTSATASEDEMMGYFREMNRARRMEIMYDNLYKARHIRGFCHLYDGQEAVAYGMNEALSKRDNIISTYRCHVLQLSRGSTVKGIAAELFGFIEGDSKGKGGSMHFYSKENRFWGGAGIVGAQVPVGAGIAFADKMTWKKEDGPMPVTLAMFGDGAANQGQIHEAANMAKLWDLPVMFVCENNQYGMGTSVARHSSNPDYYTQGGEVIPGIRIDGMDVLAVREGIKWAKDWCGSGKGPLFVEFKTYRYHGHSMSDPGTTYRDRKEVADVRRSRDCIQLVRDRIVSAGWATEKELKAEEKKVREEVTAEIDAALQCNLPPVDHMYTDIYYNEVPDFIRGAERTTSLIDGKMGGQ